jgi:apoptosis-stimulating of p53 protein 1
MYIFIFHLNRTPLHCAASCNNLPIVKFLVEHGACIFATTISDQETAAEKCVEEEEGFDNCSDYLYSMFIFYS